MVHDIRSAKQEGYAYQDDNKQYTEQSVRVINSKKSEAALNHGIKGAIKW